MTMPANTSGSDSPSPARNSWQRLSQSTLSIQAIRQVDQRAITQYHMSSLVLMENAALGCVSWLSSRFPVGKRTTILCGRGNNGGDGLAIARHLRVLGWPTRVVQYGPIDRLSADALANWRILTARGSVGCHVVDDENGLDDQISTEVNTAIDSAEVIIDAMLGSGAAGTPRAPLSNWIERSNGTSALRVAIDIPTGLDATSGQVSSITFRAAATLTFVAHKPGFSSQLAQEYLGQVVVLPIGIPIELIEELL